MVEDGTSPAAWSAARLGSRNARRQVHAALAHAAEFGAYSVGFALERGGLAGFTVYLAGGHAGHAGGKRACFNMAAMSAMEPSSHRGSYAATGHAQPMARDAASQRQPWQQHTKSNVAEKRSAFLPHCAEGAAPGAAPAPATAAVRRRGCRAGKRRKQRNGGGQSSTAVAHSHSDAHVLGSTGAHVVMGDGKVGGSAMSPAPADLPKAPPPSSLSHKAPSFTPSCLRPAPVVCLPPPVTTSSAPVPSKSELVASKATDGVGKRGQHHQSTYDCVVSKLLKMPPPLWPPRLSLLTFGADSAYSSFLSPFSCCSLSPSPSPPLHCRLCCE